jgi:hypothetical protein
MPDQKMSDEIEKSEEGSMEESEMSDDQAEEEMIEKFD